jgi:type VI protein secretion system component VasK
VFPAAWLERQGSIEAARAVRDDLLTITRILKVCCPVSVLIPGMETLRGFTEFLARIPADLIPRRCGYSFSPPQALTSDLAQLIMSYMTRWFYGYGLDAMFFGRKREAQVEPLLDQVGNNQIFSFDHEFRQLRPKLRSVLENSFPYHPDLEPVLFQGCYFLATGDSPQERAFAAGLIRDREQGIFSDQRYAAWSNDARISDGYYRRWAIAIGLMGASLCALIWLYLLRQADVSGWWGIVPIALIFLCGYAILRFSRM